jgi:hypothetical protein
MWTAPNPLIEQTGKKRFRRLLPANHLQR